MPEDCNRLNENLQNGQFEPYCPGDPGHDLTILHYPFPWSAEPASAGSMQQSQQVDSEYECSSMYSLHTYNPFHCTMTGCEWLFMHDVIVYCPKMP